MNETVYNWTFNFHKVVRQQNSGAVADFILPYSAVCLRIRKWKNYWNRSTFAKVIVKIKVARFFMAHCVVAYRDFRTGAVISCVTCNTLYLFGLKLPRLSFSPKDMESNWWLNDGQTDRRRTTPMRPVMRGWHNNRKTKTNVDLSAGSKATAGRDITMYQPADWTGVVGGGNYELSSHVNDTAHLNSLSRLQNSSSGNSTVTSSALCRSYNNGFTVSRIVALILLTSFVL